MQNQKSPKKSGVTFFLIFVVRSGSLHPPCRSILRGHHGYCLAVDPNLLRLVKSCLDPTIMLTRLFNMDSIHKNDVLSYFFWFFLYMQKHHKNHGTITIRNTGWKFDFRKGTYIYCGTEPFCSNGNRNFFCGIIVIVFKNWKSLT